MNDTFLPGKGFDTYEEQDRVLMGLSGSVRSGVAVRILQQQGFAVLTFTAEDTADTPAAPATLQTLLAEPIGPAAQISLRVVMPLWSNAPPATKLSQRASAAALSPPSIASGESPAAARMALMFSCTAQYALSLLSAP